MLRCGKCGAILLNINSFKRHNRQFHRTTKPPPPKMLCSMCDTRFHSHSDLEYHLREIHDIHVEHDRLSFSSVEDFDEWKQEIELENLAKYIRSSSKKKSDKTLVYYRCDRSGKPRTLQCSKELRQRKLKCSRKTGFQCISRISAQFFLNGTVNIEFCKTHSGHSMQVKHLCISNPTKKTTASKIEAKIPSDEVLKLVKRSPDDELKRKHLITRQDVSNISEQYSIECDWVLSNDEEQEWIEEVVEEQEGPAVEEATIDESEVAKNDSSKVAKNGSSIAENTDSENLETSALINSFSHDQDNNIYEIVSVDSEKKKIEQLVSSMLKEIKSVDGARAFSDIIVNAIPVVRAAEDQSQLMLSIGNEIEINTYETIEPEFATIENCVIECDQEAIESVDISSESDVIILN